MGTVNPGPAHLPVRCQQAALSPLPRADGVLEYSALLQTNALGRQLSFISVSSAHLTLYSQGSPPQGRDVFMWQDFLAITF